MYLHKNKNSKKPNWKIGSPQLLSRTRRSTHFGSQPQLKNQQHHEHTPRRVENFFIGKVTATMARGAGPTWHSAILLISQL